MTLPLDGRRITAVILVLALLGVGTLFITGIDESADAQAGSDVADLLDDANERTEEVRQMEVAANRVLVQWISGGGIGVGLGVLVGGYGMYVVQKNGLEEEFS